MITFEESIPMTGILQNTRKELILEQTSLQPRMNPSTLVTVSSTVLGRFLFQISHFTINLQSSTSFLFSSISSITTRLVLIYIFVGLSSIKCMVILITLNRIVIYKFKIKCFYVLIKQPQVYNQSMLPIRFWNNKYGGKMTLTQINH